MGVRKLRPITPAMRWRSVSDFAEITTNKPEKSLLETLTRSSGRNDFGHRANRNRGGGHKRKYRVIDFKRDKHGIPAVVKTIEYDPNRSARIVLLFYKDGEKRYIIAPEKLKVGQTVVSGSGVEPAVGNAMPLSEAPLGAIVHNVELHPGRGAQMARSAGTYAQLTAKEGRYVVLKLPSGEVRRVLSNAYATIGSVGNAEHENIQVGKAGRSRWLGRRPRVRGVAMNPVDHPMGGGEGRASGGQPRSRKGLYAKGKKTRNRKKHSTQFIITRRKARK